MVAVSFSILTIIDLIAQGFFGGDIQIAGLAILGVTLVITAIIMAKIKAPLEYALLPAMIITALFASLGVINSTFAFLLIILAGVPLATRARQLVGD